jgi:hypothetical protein
MPKTPPAKNVSGTSSCGRHFSPPIHLRYPIPNSLHPLANTHPTKRYLDPFISNLKRFLDKFGPDGKSDLNAACTSHQLTIHPQESTTFSYGGLEIADGILRIVFADTYLGTNTSDVSQDFASALKTAPPPPGGAGPLNIDARNAIREDYDPEIEKVRAKIAQLVNMPDIKLNGNFEHNATELAKLDKDVHYQWDKKIGQTTLAYFEGVAKAIERLGFKGDDMLQEGFQEGVEKGEICVRIVDKLGEGNSYNEVIVEKGVLYVQVRNERVTCPPSLSLLSFFLFLLLFLSFFSSRLSFSHIFFSPTFSFPFLFPSLPSVSRFMQIACLVLYNAMSHPLPSLTLSPRPTPQTGTQTSTTPPSSSSTSSKCYAYNVQRPLQGSDLVPLVLANANERKHERAGAHLP